MERRNWKCRFCDFETNDYEELIAHEKKCFDVFESNRKKRFEEELVEDMNVLNSKRQEYIKCCENMEKKYNGTNGLSKFDDLFSYDPHIDKNKDDEIHFITGSNDRNAYSSLIDLLKKAGL